MHLKEEYQELLTTSSYAYIKGAFLKKVVTYLLQVMVPIHPTTIEH